MAKIIDSTQGRYIKKIYGGMCGIQNSRILYYRNTHPKWYIKIIVDHHWIYNNEQHREQQEYVFLPNPNANLGVVHKFDVRMGCSIPGPTSQQFHWDIIDAMIVSKD